MKVIIDNIGFSLQRMGGLSVVWGTLLNALKQSGLSYECMEYPNCEYNQVRKNITDLNAVKYNPYILRIERYLDPCVKLQEPFIFHSSHYRICTNPNAINITTVHDFTYERYRKGLPKWIHSWQKFRAIRKADIVVCISESTKSDILKYIPDISEEKIRIIYNGVSEDYCQISCKTYRNLGEYVLFVGSRQPYKQFDLLVEALSKTEFNLVIVGGALNKKEVLFLNEMLGESRYNYMGYLPNSKLNELYNQAYCLAYPSAYEGFGIPVLEAQRAGCPVIAYNASSIPEVIGETPLLLDCLSVEEFKNKLLLLKDKNVRDSIVKSGLENSKRFSWDKMGNEYISLYKDIIAGRI